MRLTWKRTKKPGYRPICGTSHNVQGRERPDPRRGATLCCGGPNSDDDLGFRPCVGVRWGLPFSTVDTRIAMVSAHVGGMAAPTLRVTHVSS